MASAEAGPGRHTRDVARCAATPKEASVVVHESRSWAGRDVSAQRATWNRAGTTSARSAASRPGGGLTVMMTKFADISHGAVRASLAVGALLLAVAGPAPGPHPRGPPPAAPQTPAPHPAHRD